MEDEKSKAAEAQYRKRQSLNAAMGKRQETTTESTGFGGLPSVTKRPLVAAPQELLTSRSALQSKMWTADAWDGSVLREMLLEIRKIQKGQNHVSI